MNRLVERWRGNEGRIALRKIIRALCKGGEFDRSLTPFGEYGELLDLRGAPLRGLNLVRNEVNRCTLHDADLSGADFTNCAIEKCVFQNVQFDEADLCGTVHRGNRFLNCSFIKTYFIQAGIGFDGNHFERCRFERATFTRCGCVRGEFDDCEFISCNLKGMDFSASSFVRSRFAGRVEDVWFRGGYGFPGEAEEFGAPRPNRMDHVSFTDALLWDPTFSDNCDLSTVAPPLDGKHIVVSGFREGLMRVVNAKAKWQGPVREKADLFCEVFRTHSLTQDWYIFNIENERERYGPAADPVLRILSDASTQA